MVPEKRSWNSWERVTLMTPSALERAAPTAGTSSPAALAKAVVYSGASPIQVS